MAQRTEPRRDNQSATKSRPGNQTPNTPPVRESDYRRMRVDELRDLARRHQLPGLSAMRKDDLVRAVIKAENAARRRPADRGGRTAKPPQARQRAGQAGKSTGASGTGAARSNTARAGTSSKVGAGSGRARGGPTGGGVRLGPNSSRSLRYAQEIRSPQDRPERPGRSLVTTSHEIIQSWAAEREATPATVPGRAHGDRPGVLTFDFPINGRNARLQLIDWPAWFRSFDERGLNFIYQETRSDGRQSNFFRLENPKREDA